MLFYVGWLFFSVAAGIFAEKRRNRHGVGWFVVALVFSPLVAFVLLMVLDNGKDKPVADPVAAHLRTKRQAQVALVLFFVGFVIFMFITPMIGR